MREIIKVKNVSKVYKINKRKSGLFGAVLNLFAPRYEKKIAVSDMNFSIEEGEAVAFIGSNGAGKSTTIKMLSGILYPSEGEITVASYVPYKQRKKYVSNIGVVLGQKSQLVWDLPVRDGYELIRHIYKISKEDYEKRLDEFIEMLDMKEFINQPVRQLSLGQKMRAEIVATMLHNPKIIFLDEPTIGLDLVAKKKIQDFIRTINKKYNVTIIFTTHDMQDIVSTCERLIIIDKGKKIYDGAVKNVKELCDDVKILRVEMAQGEKVSNDGLLNIKECDENIVEIMFEKPKLQLERVSKYLNDNYLVKSIRPMSSEQDILEVVTKDSQMIVDTTIYESEKIHDNHFRINLEEICKVNDALEEAKIKFAVLKGAFFGCEMYEKGTRRSNDIDLLVYEDDLGKLDTCLRAMGYIQSNMSNGEMVEATKKEKIIQRMNYHDLVPYVKKTKMGILELDINFLFDGNKNLIDKNVYEMAGY